MTHKDIHPRPFHKSINVPTSKSYANRLLILASLQKGPVSINNLPLSSDVLDLIRCLKEVGLRIEKKGSGVSVTNSFPECEPNDPMPCHLNTGEGGTTTRFLIPFLSLGKRAYFLHLGPAMTRRPMDEFISPLKKLNVKINFKNGLFYLQGPATKKGDIHINCSRSTQFASSFILSMGGPTLNIIPDKIKSSHSYLELTKKLLTEVKSRSTLEVPSDFSSMSYPLAMAVTDGYVCIENYTGHDAYQGDSHFIDILKGMGGRLVRDENKGIFKVNQSPLKGINVDCSDCLDIVPSLLYLCAYAEGRSLLKNISALRHKESDRISAMEYLLKLFCVDYCRRDESIEIRGPAKRMAIPIDVYPPKDHRIVMTAYLFLRHNAGGKLYEVESVEKSFPHFFSSMA